MDEIVSFVTNYHEPLLVGAAAFILVLVVGYGLYKVKKVPGEEPMKKEEVRRSLRQLRREENAMIADIVGDGLLTALAAGKLTPERYDAWHLRFGKRVGLIDLLKPGRKLTEAQRKKACAARIKYLQSCKPIPTPVVKETKKPKNVVEEILNAT